MGASLSIWAGVMWLRRHSPLAGSDDLEEWARSAAESVASAYRDRVLAPILQLKDELFATFRQRRSIVSVGEYETDKASLERMLKDFQADFGAGSSVSPCLWPQQLGMAFHAFFLRIDLREYSLVWRRWGKMCRP